MLSIHVKIMSTTEHYKTIRQFLVSRKTSIMASISTCSVEVFFNAFKIISFLLPLKLFAANPGLQKLKMSE